jgi:micrococcal nuclease
MFRSVGLPVLWVTVLLPARLPGQAPPDASCVIARVVDGDTFRCRDGTRVRLIGMDSPESGQGVAARQATVALLRMLPPGRRVRLERERRARDRYGRLLADVWAGDTLVNEAMVLQGWAVVFTVPPDVRYLGRLRTAEAAARVARRGLWASGDIECRPVAYRHRECGAGP